MSSCRHQEETNLIFVLFNTFRSLSVGGGLRKVAGPAGSSNTDDDCLSLHWSSASFVRADRGRDYCLVGPSPSTSAGTVVD